MTITNTNAKGFVRDLITVFMFFVDVRLVVVERRRHLIQRIDGDSLQRTGKWRTLRQVTGRYQPADSPLLKKNQAVSEGAGRAAMAQRDTMRNVKVAALS